MANSMSVESVRQALRSVYDPDLKRDLVSLNMIEDLAVTPQGDVSLRVVLTTPACPMKAKMEAEVRAAVESVPGVRSIAVKMDARVQGKVEKNQIPGVQNIIAVSSGKGGVGKSTVAVNLAVSLALEGARVGLMDADIYGPNVPTMTGVVGQPVIEQDPVRGEVFIPPVSHGVKVMSMGFLVQGDQPMIWRGPMLHNILQQFCHRVQWGELDYLVIDMPPGTGDVQLSLAQLISMTGAVMVTTPQEVALQDVRKAFQMWDKVKVPSLGIVENMSYFKCGTCDTKHVLFGEGGGKSLQSKFGAELLAQLPIVQEVRAGGDEGRPVVVRAPQSEIATAFRDLARKVAQQVSLQNSKQVDPSQLIQIGRFN
jgi:ATP-binding protein involved in chromosome partitioning